MSAGISEDELTAFNDRNERGDLSIADVCAIISSHRTANKRIAELDVQLLKCRNIVAMLRDLTAARIDP
jgi:hypothetical protein